MNITINTQEAFALLKLYPQGTTIEECVNLLIKDKLKEINQLERETQAHEDALNSITDWERQ